MESQRVARKPPPLERKPTLLKEFLRDDFSSCSSSGFRSYPRRQSCYLSVRSLLEMDLKTRELELLPKSNFFKKASVAVFSAVKSLHFAQKQSILSKSLSRRLKRSFTKSSNKSGDGGGDERIKHEITVVVKVKDILRWKSFATKELDCSASPIQTSITNTTTTTTSSNSWCDSDFTSEYLSGSSEYSGENESEDGKKSFTEKKKVIRKRRGDEDSMEKTHGDSKYEDKDQSSPVSVMDFPFEEDDESSSSFQSSLENMEKTKHKLMQKIRRFESLAKIEPLFLENRIASYEMDDVEEVDEDIHGGVKAYKEQHHHDEEYIRAEDKAVELLKLFITTTTTTPTIKECFQNTTNDLLLDFFRDEILEANVAHNLPRKDGLECELLKVSKDWMDGKIALLDWRVEESRKVHIKEMERGGEWRDLEVDKKELSMEIEVGVLNFLIDEILSDLLS